MKGQKLFEKAKLILESLHEKNINMSRHEVDELTNAYKKTLRKSAYYGNNEAQYELAQFLETTSNILETNYNKKSFYWYQKSCNNGNADACLLLSDYYVNGKVVSKNKTKELSLMLKAYNLNCNIAAFNIAIFYKRYKEYNKSIEWLKKYLELAPSDGDAIFELSTFYYEGLGTKKHFKKSYELMLDAMKSNYITQYCKEEIFFRIAKMYFYGIFFEKSLEKAKYLLEKANTNNDHENVYEFYKTHNALLKNIKKEKVTF